MFFTTCFWTLLSQKDLSFVYLSPWLSKSLGSEHDLLLGTSFFDYFHPEEQELARHDLSELVKKKTLTYSVTRCQYNTIQTIRRKLQQSIISSSKSSSQQMPSQYSPVSSTMTSPNFTTTVPQEIQQSNDEYIVMDVGMNVVSQEFVLACFHSDDVKQSNSNCVSSKCGETEFTKEEVNKLTSFMRKHGFSKVQTPPSTPFPEIIVNNETPNRIFQILDKKSRNLIFSWPDTNDHISNVSYNKNDFSRLLKNVILDSNNNITRNNNLVKGTDVESPNCLKLISDKHYLLTSGTYRQVESVIIPYGDIIFACFQILPSTILSVSSAFSKPKARSAPCSPSTTINNNNGIAKRPRSPGSLSPLPSPFYDDDIRRYVQNHHHSNTSHYPQEVPDFILEKRSSKRHRIDPPSVSSANDSLVPVKISYSPPNPPQLLLNPISPKASPSYLDQQQRRQFPFPPQIIKDQPPQTLQPPQQPYYPFVVPPSGPQSRQPSPKQQDYPSPKNHPSQFLNQNNNHHNHTVQPQQSPPSSQSQSSVAVAHQQRRNNNGNNNNNSNANNNNSNNNVQGAKKCESCHTSTSPEWRRGPTGHKTLCNACGLRYSRTIARENRKREQAQREQEQRQREQREREERARERAAATAMMNRGVIEPPFPQYVRTSNAIIPPGQQQQQQHHHHHHHSPHSSGPSQQYHSSTLPPLNYHRHHQPSLPQPQTSHHHHSHHHHNVHNVHHNAHPVPPPLNDRIGYTLPPPNFIDRQQNGVVGASNGYQIGNSVIGVGVMTDNHRRDQLQHNGEGERYTTNVMNNMPPTANAYPKEAYFGRAQ